MLKFQRGVVIFVLVLSLVAVYGCAKPPTKELGDAQAAIASAEQAGAADYAPAELDSAKQALSDANSLIEQKKYKDAIVSLQGVVEKANAAVSSAEANKATMQMDVEAKIPEAEAALGEIQAALADAGKKKVPADQIQAASDTAASAEAAIAQAKTDLESGNIKAASDALAPLADQLTGAKTAVADAIAAMKPAKRKK